MLYQSNSGPATDPNILKFIWREIMWSEIFDRALKRGKVFDAKLGDYFFQYALINSKDGYGRDTVSTKGEQYTYRGKGITYHLKKDEKKTSGVSYAGLAFVLERALPRMDFADYIGLHEYVESLFLGLPRNIPGSNLNRQHAEACKLELGEVFKQSADFIEAYAGWIVEQSRRSKKPHKGYFGRANPRIMSLVLNPNMKPLDILTEFKNQLDMAYNDIKPQEIIKASQCFIF